MHSKTFLLYLSILHTKNPFKLHKIIFTKLCYTFIIIYYVTFIFMGYLLFRYELYNLSWLVLVFLRVESC